MDAEIEALKKENEELKDLNRRLTWRHEHARTLFRMFMESAVPFLDEDKRNEIFQAMGRHCSASLQWAERHIGDPVGFFASMKATMGEEISMSDDGKTITVVTPKRPCECPLMKGVSVGGYFCECSKGWQARTYETILGKPVEVSIKEAVFRGSDRCVFEIKVLG